MASGSGGNHNQRNGNANRPQSPGSNAPGSRPSPTGDDVDFGAFVSERVRSASERLKGTEAGKPAEPPRPTTPPADRPATPAATPTPNRRQRPSHYWRDSLKESTGEEVDELGETSQRFIGSGATRRPSGPVSGEDAGDGEGDGGVPWWQSLSSGDGDGPNRSLILYAAIGLVILALIVFGIIRLFGGDEEEPPVEPTPIITVEQGGEATEASTPTSRPDSGPEPTETPEIRRGGDNQRTPSNDEGTPAGSVIDYESEVALACSAECLIRVIDDNAADILQETGNRPSFVRGDVAWAVVSAPEAEELDRQTEIALVEDSEQTYNLYVITAPGGSVDTAFAADYGEVLDAIGVHALVAFNQVPAQVKSLLENGYEVNKLAPAPASDIPARGEASDLADASTGTLMGEVDSGNLADTMDDLSSTGELDNSGVGTRYYSLPGNQIAADYLFQELESYGLDVWYEDFVSWDGFLLVNVVGEIPGRDDSESYAVMSHFDTFSTTNPRQAPGADDNATGIAVNLETARVLAGYEPNHPVRFVFVNAEEVGIQGALAWARRANADGLNVRGVLNVDSVGSSRQGQYVVTNANDSSRWLQQELSDVNDDYELGQVMQHLQDTEIIADDNMLRDEGIDAVMIARELYGWTPFHHTPDDTMDNVSITSVTNMTYLTMLTIVRLAG